MQHYANVVLDYLERVDRHKSEIRELKLALVTAHILQPFDAFPELKPDDDEDTDELPDEEDQVTYLFPNEPGDQQSIEDELRQMLAASSQGTAAFNESEEDWV